MPQATRANAAGPESCPARDTARIVCPCFGINSYVRETLMNLKRTSCAVVLSLVVCRLLLAQDAGLGPGEREKPKLIHAGHLLDVRTGAMLNDQAILIGGDRISEVGPWQTVSAHAPAESALIDLSNATVLPGLIDCHTHLTFSPERVGYQSLGISIPR